MSANEPAGDYREFAAGLEGRCLQRPRAREFRASGACTAAQVG
jgi:hypothetical protein